MTKQLKKQVVLFFTLLALFGVAGCGDNISDGENQRKNRHMEFPKNRLYQAEEVKLEGITGEPWSYVVCGDSLCLITWEDQKDAQTEGGRRDIRDRQHIYFMNLDGTNPKEIALDKIPGNYIYAMAYGADGNLILRLEERNEEGHMDEEWLVRMDLEGNVLEQQNIMDSLHESYAMYNMTADKEGRVYFCYMEYLYLFNADLTFEKEITPKFSLDSVGYTKDGAIICAGADSKEKFICTLDFDTGEFGKRYMTGTDWLEFSAGCLEMDGYDFYYTNDYGGYGYDMEQEKSTYLFDYQMSDLYSGDFSDVQAVGGGQFAAIEYRNGKRFILLSQGDMTKWENKKVITYGIVDAMTKDVVEQKIAEFNRENDTFRVELKDYSEEEDPQMAFNLDILSGDVPDIIALEGLPADQYIAKGLLEDLTPYYEKDEDIGTEELLDSVVEATKVDGKLYYMTPVFSVCSVIAKKSDVGERDGITFGEVKDILDKKEERVQPFDAGGEKIYMLFAFLSAGYSDFIDWETGKCRFDSQDFKDILEICNRKSSLTEYEYSEGWGEPELLRQGIVLFTGTWIDLSQLQLYRGLYQEDITLIGYPCETGEGSYFECPSRMGIYADSENKEEAWEFLKGFQEKEFQEGDDMFWNGLPIRKDAFELYIQIHTAEEGFTDELGRYWSKYQGSSGPDGVMIDIGPAPEEDVELFRKLIDNTHKTVERNPAVDEIIEDAVKAYFAGVKSLDKTAEEIQNRVSTYVSESR